MIYLVRHGLDDERYLGGWSDVDLIDEGYKQIENATKFIVDKKLVINKIISSDVIRARNTANIINKQLKLQVSYTKDLRELNKGLYNGVLKKSLGQEELLRIKKFDINDKYPLGESTIELYNRMKKCLKKLEKYDNVLIVTHRGVINMFYYLLNDLELDMDKERFDVTHGSIHEMDIIRKLIRRIF